jgi:hypothetical protein
MASPVVVSTEIARPADEVFAYATDPTRFTEWQAGVVDGHLDTSEPVRAGALCITSRRIGGATRSVTSVVTHVDPPRAWGVRGTDGPIRATVGLTVQPLTNDSSRLTISVGFDGSGIGKILVPLLVRRQARREMPANIATLKQRVESAQTRQGRRGLAPHAGWLCVSTGSPVRTHSGNPSSRRAARIPRRVSDRTASSA